MFSQIKQTGKKIGLISTLLPMSMFLAFPASTNYQLKSFEFSGGGGTGSSANYQAEGTVGEIAGEQSSANYEANSGLQFVQMSNTPGAPTFTNDSSWYNKLKIVINTSNNPSDTTYAIAISSDNWATTQYVQNDNTIGSTLSTEDFQTYAQWGGATGENIIGLSSETTYKVKVKARQGIYTESGYGPEASATTSALTLTFDIDVSSTDAETAAPYAVPLSNLSPGSVTTASNKIWVDFATNAEYGGVVYIYDAYGGLRSSTVNYTISSFTGDLTGATEGFGVRSDTATATSGSLTSQSPYNGTADTVGTVDSTIRELYTSSGAPITGGRGSILIKAKSADQTPAASDYEDTLTIIAAGNY